mgnify:CR=1 FL=1
MISSAFESILPKWFKVLCGFRRKPNDRRTERKEVSKVWRK